MPRNKSHARRAIPLIVVAGCLVMPYVAATGSAVFIDFMRAFGAREIHFGLISGIPMIMLSLQFLGGLLSNAVRSRKALFIALGVASRVLYLPVAFVPLLFPGLPREGLVNTLLVLVAVSACFANMIGPPWFSWVADLIPRQVLSRFWGLRQTFLNLTASVCQLGIVLFAILSGWPATKLFPILVAISVPLGVMDILLFLWVHEPPNTIVRGRQAFATLVAPFRSPDFRWFLVFSCAWNAAAMFSAAFMQPYALKVLGLSVGQTAFVWCFLGFGVALSSGLWGRLVDDLGHRPVFIFGMYVKPLIALVFVLITPRTAMWILCPAFLIDSMWNAAMMIATNGYMLKFAPPGNRSMYVAATAGLAGICGGLGAMIGGVFLEATSSFSLSALGRTWNHYQLLFLVGIALRVACNGLAFRIREPTSSSTRELIRALRQVRPMDMVLFPIGVYRLLTGRPWKEESTGQDGVI